MAATLEKPTPSEAKRAAIEKGVAASRATEADYRKTVQGGGDFGGGDFSDDDLATLGKSREQFDADASTYRSRTSAAAHLAKADKLLVEIAELRAEATAQRDGTFFEQRLSEFGDISISKLAALCSDALSHRDPAWAPHAKAVLLPPLIRQERELRTQAERILRQTAAPELGTQAALASNEQHSRQVDLQTLRDTANPRPRVAKLENLLRQIDKHVGVWAKSLPDPEREARKIKAEIRAIRLETADDVDHRIAQGEKALAAATRKVEASERAWLVPEQMAWSGDGGWAPLEVYGGDTPSGGLLGAGGTQTVYDLV